MRRRFSLVLLLLAVMGPAHAGAPVEPAVPALPDASALQADVDVLESAYKSLHPGLLRYNTPAEVDAHFRDLRTALTRARDLRQAYLAFSEFAATLKCGHTYANFSNQTKAIQRALFEGQDRVPFEFRWIGGRMIVTRDLTPDHVLPRGTEVVSIDAVPADRILARLMRIARADGSNDGKRVALLEVQGTETWETFDIFLPLYFPQVDATQTLHVRAPDGQERDIDVAALTYAQRLAFRRDADAPRSGWTLDATDPALAVLRMPTWALYDEKWDWKAFIEETFATLSQRGTKALVIDLRENEGGVDVGDAILAHLIDARTTTREPPALVRYRKVPDALAPMLDTWDPSFKDWGDQARDFDGRFYTLHRWEADAGVAVHEPKAPRFAGRVFVLVGPNNSSATFQFAQQVRAQKLGTLVGRTTGGNQRGINGGAFFFLRLPNSQIELDLPLIARIVADAPDAGLEPDLRVEATVADIAAGRDVEMDAVRQTLPDHGMPVP